MNRFESIIADLSTHKFVLWLGDVSHEIERRIRATPVLEVYKDTNLYGVVWLWPCGFREVVESGVLDNLRWINLPAGFEIQSLGGFPDLKPARKKS